MEPKDLEGLRAMRRELPLPLDPVYEDVILRVIQVTGDLSYAQTLRFSPGIVPLIRSLLAQGAALVADVPMVLAGIDAQACGRLGIQTVCPLEDGRAAFQPGIRSIPQAHLWLERALSLPGPKVLVCGSSPALLLPAIARRPADTPIVALPAGFNQADQAKARLWESGLPCIVNVGRHGGCEAAAAIVNALIYGVSPDRSNR